MMMEGGVSVLKCRFRFIRRRSTGTAACSGKRVTRGPRARRGRHYNLYCKSRTQAHSPLGLSLWASESETRGVALDLGRCQDLQMLLAVPVG